LLSNDMPLKGGLLNLAIGSDLKQKVSLLNPDGRSGGFFILWRQACKIESLDASLVNNFLSPYGRG